MTRYLKITCLLTTSIVLLFCRTSFGRDFAKELDCFISPHVTANVGSEVVGVITAVSVDRGDRVRKGQVIAQLDTKVEKVTLELKKARLEYIKREHARKLDLFKNGIIASSEIDELETNMNMAQREVEEISQNIERRIIRSPFDGVVVERLLSAGERVEEKPIFKLAQLDPLNVEIFAPASFIGRVRVGDRAAVRPEKPVDREIVGRVKIVDNVLDASSGTLGIRVELKNSNYAIPAGLKCQVRFMGK